jgi:hypothetical protein
MALRSPKRFHSFWGAQPTVTNFTSPLIEVGDTVFGEDTGFLYSCASINPVVWIPVGSGAVPAHGAINSQIADSAIYGVPKLTTSIYIPSDRTLSTESRAHLGAMAPSQVQLSLIQSGTNNLVGFFVGSTNAPNEFVDVQLMEIANVTAGWYDVVLTALDNPSTVFVRGLYLTT